MSVIQGIYIALFGRPADPGGLAYWNEVTKNGADLSEMLRVLPATEEYTSRFEGQTPDQVIETIYVSLFNRKPDPEGLAFFKEQLASGAQNMATIAVNILQGAQGDDKADIEAKVEAAELFTASLDTEAEIEAYKGADAAALAKKFIDTVDKDNKPTADAVEKAADAVAAGQDPTEGQAPVSGGGGNTTTPPPNVASFSDDKLVIAAGADATVVSQGGNHTISALGFTPITIQGTRTVSEVVVSVGSTLNVDAAVAGTILGAGTPITGTGNLNVTGVTISQAIVNGSPVQTSPDLFSIYERTDAKFLVNGSEADAIKAIWDMLDENYVAAGYDNITVNLAFVELGLRYVAYLESGGAPFTDFIAKTNVTDRAQSMHDNLLGNLNAHTLASRFTGDQLAELKEAIDDAYEGRAVFDGNKSQIGGANHDGVRAFDYDKGWARPDYLDILFGKVAPLASEDRGDGFGEQMLYGSGNSNNNFSIVRHEGAGIELALKAKVFGANGGDYTEGSRKTVGDIVHYNVNRGTSDDNANRADWSIDYAGTVLAQGHDEQVTFRLYIDVDASAGVTFVEIPTTSYKGLIQGSSNYGFDFIKNQVDIDPDTGGIQAYNFGPGQFDIKFEATTSDGLEVSNTIVVHVDGFNF